MIARPREWSDVMGVTAVCAQGHRLRPVESLGLLRNRRIEPMYKQTHKRISWHKLICVVSALLVMAAPMLGALCAPADCSSQNSKAAAPCSGMDMPKCATSVNAQSRLACCQSTQSLAATISQNMDTQKVKAELSPVFSGIKLAGLVATQRMAPRPVDGPPPHDVQSLICILLI